MRIGEVVGGVALVGVAVLVGIALTDDDAPEIITADTSPFVFDASSTTITSTTSTAPAAGSTCRRRRDDRRRGADHGRDASPPPTDADGARGPADRR